MGTLVTEKPQSPAERPPVVNDFSFVAATANGTGSQTANITLLRALFKMGIPVHGKNIFPSNIQGLPTWYHIRVSKDGYVARPSQAEILIAFNVASVHEDIKELPAGGVCIYNSDIKGMPTRDDISMYGISGREFAKYSELKDPKLLSYAANMSYVGVLVQLLGIELEAIEEALNHQFKGKAKAVIPNMNVVKAAYDYSLANFQKTDPYQVEPMDKTNGLIMLTGNEAAGLGAVFGGASFVAWYPITPSTSLVDAMNDYLPKFRSEADGKKTYAVVQAEDELAAIGMVLGAGWMGARAMTATSGPGISLMSEFAGMSYFAEIPAVIWNIQRIGPSTGLPTRTGQCDITFAYYLGHGDTKNVLLFPSDLKECFEFGSTAFDLAESLQTLVLVMSDLDLGMNNWMSEPFDYPKEPLKRGKVLTAEDLSHRANPWGRYLDEDGDGIPYRTLPGTDHPSAAYFARGTGHDEYAKYSEKADVWERNMLRLKRKFDTARKLVPKPVVTQQAGAKVGIIAYGTTKFAIDEARDKLIKRGLPTNFMRLRALPMDDEVKAFVAAHDKSYVIELNRDGQAHGILQHEMPEMATKLISLAHLDGMPLTADWVIEALAQHESFE